MSEASAPAGWYTDPQLANTQRYWDGAAWTEHRAPLTPQSAPPPASEAQTVAENVKVLGMLTAIFLPVVGFIIGLTQINKRGNDGVVMIVTSVIAFFVWYALLTS